MARPTPAAGLPRLRHRLRAFRWRRVAVLAGVSLALSTLLVAYTFGWGNHFAGRLATAFFVSFALLAVTFLAILPFIGWAATHWFGAGWATTVDAPAARTGRPAPARPAAPRSFTS